MNQSATSAPRIGLFHQPRYSGIAARQTVGAFHDGLAWLAQLTMFFTLGLLVFPSDLVDIALKGTAVALVLVFVARPLAVMVATALAPLRTSERIVLGWAGIVVGWARIVVGWAGVFVVLFGEGQLGHSLFGGQKVVEDKQKLPEFRTSE